MMKRGRKVEGKKLARLATKKLVRGARRHDARVKFCADDMERIARERAAALLAAQIVDSATEAA